jgi:hypothetical protein
MPHLSAATALALLLLGQLTAGDERVVTDERGRIVPVPLPVPEECRNRWTAADEDSFRTRADHLIRQFAGKAGGSLALENEKQAYPVSMLAFLAGDREACMKVLEANDGESNTTNAVDLYWCFTLKGQMRKWFFFQQYLSEDYRQRMAKAIADWTATDPRPNTELVLLLDSTDPEVAAYAREALGRIWRSPADLRQMADAAIAEGHDNKKRFGEYLRSIADGMPATPPDSPAAWRDWWAKLTAGDWQVYEEYDRRTNLRPHPVHGIGQGPVGTDWSPGTRGGVVDWRNTDNLRGMRECAVYLFAEAAGNDLTRRIFKERIRRTARGFLGVGMGEWDSESYHSHTVAAYLNLYDFAVDPEVRQLAKGILDYLSTAMAVKYFHGGHCGPVKRDYGNINPWPGVAAAGYVWFGDAPENPNPHYDEVHLVTSAYRPPAAVVALARKQFPKPRELFESHPSYSNWLPGQGDEPMYHATQYYGETYQMGSMVSGPGYDEAGCKILVAHSQRGVDYIIPTSQPKGNPVNCRAHDERIAQCRNVLVWLKPWQAPAADDPRKDAKRPPPWNFIVPADAAVTAQEGVTFVRCERTWLAIFPVNTTLAGIDPAAIKAYAGKNGKADSTQAVIAGQALAAPYSGFALELGDEASHGAFEAFRDAVLAKAKLDTTGIATGKVVFTGASGASVGLQWDAGDPPIWRDGQPHDYATHRDLYRPVAGGTAPVSLGWRAGVLHVEAGGHTFTGTLDLAAGTYSSTATVAE